MSRFEVVGWRNDRVVMLDQRALPDEEIYLEFGSAAEVAQAIRDMVIRGAPAIGCAAAYGVAVEAHRLKDSVGEAESLRTALAPGVRTLLLSRPTAVNLSWAIERMMALIGEDSPEVQARRLLQEAELIRREDEAACRAMGRFGAACLPADRPLTILTHCNAGALATGGYGTALGVIRAAVEASRVIRVIATETRPYWQGARLTAWELIQDGIDTTLITDSAAGHLMSRGEIDGVVVGADRIAANGDVANKIGTYTHAVCAFRHGIPFLVAAPLSTIDRQTPNGAAIPIEERPDTEITHCRGVRLAASGVKVRNPAFDVTPAALVTVLVSEKGAIWAPDANRIAQWFL